MPKRKAPKRKTTKRKARKKPYRLPQHIIVIKNEDKQHMEKWTKAKQLDKLNYPHPVKICLCGPCNVGKTNVTKNVCVRQEPKFDRRIVVHGIHETHEYDDCDVEMMEEIPDQDELNTGEKTVIILDDINFKGLSKEQNERLNRLYGAWSTHLDGYISVIACTQDFYQLPPIVKRCTDVFVLWRPDDETELSTIGPKVGLRGDTLRNLFDKFCKTKYDNITIDKTIDSPWKIRINGYNVVKFK